MIGKAAVAGGLTLAAAAAAPMDMVDDMPVRALVAYVSAAQNAPCSIDWATLAAMGAVETGHGQSRGSRLDGDGRTSHMIGSTEGARGPMQFMGGTWAAWAVDGDGDGVADIDDIDDAAASAAELLCASGVDRDWDNAVGAYNGGAGWRSYGESRQYVADVTAHQAHYAALDPRLVGAAVPLPRAQAPSHSASTAAQSAATTTTSGPAPAPLPAERDAGEVWSALMRAWVRLGQLLDRIGLGAAWRRADAAMFAPEPRVPAVRRVAATKPTAAATPIPGLDPAFGARLAAMIAAAPGAITITSGLRTADEQMALRVAHCPDPVNSDSTECTPWTARVGESQHEQGLAADLGYADAATEQWAHDNAARYGLRYPMGNEPWHVEPE